MSAAKRSLHNKEAVVKTASRRKCDMSKFYMFLVVPLHMDGMKPEELSIGYTDDRKEILTAFKHGGAWIYTKDECGDGYTNTETVWFGKVTGGAHEEVHGVRSMVQA
jgi:hypothetical protein